MWRGADYGALAAIAITALALLHGLIVVLLPRHLATRTQARPGVARMREKTAGVFLIGFKLKLALST